MAKDDELPQVRLDRGGSSRTRGGRSEGGDEGRGEGGQPAAARLPSRSELDESQRAAVEAREEVLVVLGGPGSGKSVVAVHAALDRVASGECRPDEVVVVGATRQLAATLRDQVTAGLRGAASAPLARTVQSLGFAILRAQAALEGQPTPRLMSGAQQDLVLADLLAGHAESGTGPVWPEHLREALATRAFRGELRDLLMRAVEHSLTPDRLAALGEEHERPEWGAAARVFEEYEQVGALATPGMFDPAWVLTAASDLLESDDEARRRTLEQVGCLVVDDAQELTAPAARLLRILAGAGVPLVLVGDPDAAVQTFRGADPAVFVDDDWGGRSVGRVVLGRGYRLPSSVAAANARVVARIGALGGGAARGCPPRGEGAAVEVAVLRSDAQEAAYVAHELRSAHLLDGVAWSDMAVVVRGAARQATLRRVLAARGVPLVAAATELPLREQSAVAPLLAVLTLALDLQRGRRDVPDVEEVLDLLGSPYVRADPVAVRRLRRRLRSVELASEGARSSDELLRDLVVAPEEIALLAVEDPSGDTDPLLRLARIIAAAREAAPVQGERWAPGVTAEGVLWAAWEAAGVAQQWRARALAGGAAGARADEALDAVVALFSAAAAHEDTVRRGGPEMFLEAVAQQEVAADSLAARSPSTGAVSLVTPAGCAGRQWRRVVVAGVQEGVWPDLRLRGSMLGSEDLVEIMTGRGAGEAAAARVGGRGTGPLEAARVQVRHDETRLLHVALTRASEAVLVTAVRSEDEHPSPFLEVIDPLPDDGEGRTAVEAPLPMDLVGVVARLRQELGRPEGTEDTTQVALDRLAALRAAGVRGADPRDWWALRGLTDDRPLRSPDEQVPLSPSQVEAFEECGLAWLLTSSGGRGVGHVSQSLGTLLHAIAEDLPDADHETIAAEIEARWPQLGQHPGWVGEQNKQRAHRMGRWLADYYLTARREGWRLAGVEVPFRADVGRATISGRVDRVEHDTEGALRVIDYKTGGSTPGPKEMPAHRQLGVYQLAVQEGAFAELGATSAGAALVNLGKAANRSSHVRVQAPLAGSENPEWVREVVGEVVDGMAAAHVPARPEERRCAICPVRSSCPAHEEGRMLR